MPSPFVAFDSQYSAHTDLAIHPVTGVVYITVAFHPNNGGGYNCRVWELPSPYTGQPKLIRDWVQGAPYSFGPFGHGASIPLPTGKLLTCVPVAGDSAEVRPSLLIDAVMGLPAYTSGGQGPKGDPGARGDKGDPGTPGTGSDPQQLAAILRQLDALAAQVDAIESRLTDLSSGGAGLDEAQVAALKFAGDLKALIHGA